MIRMFMEVGTLHQPAFRLPWGTKPWPRLGRRDTHGQRTCVAETAAPLAWVVAGVLLWSVWLLLPKLVPAVAVFGVIGGAVLGLAIVAWWLFFSRAPWVERAGAVVLMAIALVTAPRFVHISVSNGMMGMMPYIFGLPVLSSALVIGAVASRLLTKRLRPASMVASVAIACAALAVVRTDGLSGDGVSDLHLRWTETPEQRLLAQEPEAVSAPGTSALSTAPGTIAASLPAVSTAASTAAPSTPEPHGAPGTRAPSTAGATEAEWPGFRGPNRDGIVPAARIDTDWSQHPPARLWTRAIGPGWSSFAVSGDLLYTQERRGDDETVACYRVTTGEPVWRHRDNVRFWESNGGAGPRATPTLSGGRVYTFDATGILNTLDAATGAVIWSRNAKTDTGRQIPDWGFSSSPLVVDDVVIVAVSGTLAAYDVATGKARWVGPQHGGSYSSPHLVTIDGSAQVVVMTGAGATSVDPRDGKTLWEYAWEGSTIIQPAITADGHILVSTGGAMGGVGL